MRAPGTHTRSMMGGYSGAGGHFEKIETILELVPQLRGRSASVVPLSGGITNHNYRVEVGHEVYVLRLGGENAALLGIDRDREYACSVAAAKLGIAPEVVAPLPDHDALVTCFAPGWVLTPEDARDPAVLRRMVDALRRFHDGPAIPGAFSPFATVRRYHSLAQEREVVFPDTMERALGILASIEESLRTDEPAKPCHNDLLPGNFIDDGISMSIIDWEYAGMGDRFFDLGNLAVNHELDEKHERLLVELYFGEIRPDDLRRLRLMRLASDMRESLWGFLQFAISTIDFDFHAYGRAHLERFLTMYANHPP